MSSRQKQTEGDDNEKLKAVKEMRCRFELQSRAADLRLPRRRRVFSTPLRCELHTSLWRTETFQPERRGNGTVAPQGGRNYSVSSQR